MQRKNRILRKGSYKNGIALIMAIIVIVTVATILALSLSLTSLGNKRTADLYLYEQAALLSQSATEYAMLKISKVAPCSLDTLNYTYNGIFNIRTNMQYISTAGSDCESNATSHGTNAATITYKLSNGIVIIDTAVSVTDTNVTTEPIRYFRRTIQKL